jgi:mannose-6-phosphate isomerase-like protein (cupin superfamily)
MQKKVIGNLLAILIGLPMSIDTFAQARGQGRPAPPNMPGTFTFIPKADLEAVMGPTRGDRPARVVGIGGDANMGAYILHYPPMKNSLPPSSFYHSEISELYYVIRGQGTALLGGELENPAWRPENTVSFRQVSGPGVAGTLKNYTTQKWGPGDIIIVPAGVPHTIGFEVTVTNDTLRVVVDPHKVLNLVTTRAQSLAAARAEDQPQPQSPASPAKPGPGRMPGTFTFIPKANVEALMGPTRGDRPIRVVSVGNNANLGAFILHYETMKNTPPVSSFYHSEISELYYVIRGSGTALLGGQLENAIWDNSNSDAIRQVRGPSVNGTIKNYQTVKWTAGDTIVVPAGVPHTMGFEVTERTDILRVVFDPKKSIQQK